MPLAAGVRLGPYEIVAPLGAGGMGEVYRARDTRLGRSVALKVLPAHRSASPEARLRLEREARAISQLSHPHICTLFDVGREGDTDYLVMELLEGETLERRVSRGPLPIADVLRHGGEIARALERAHRAGIVHRDLKPGNVMVTKSGVKLLDFGLARPAEGAFASAGAGTVETAHAGGALTGEGTVVGTLAYMSPEQVEGRPADARSDLFALGCVLYEMLAGRRPFAAASAAATVAAILRGEPVPLHELRPDCPPALDRLVRACLVKDPDERWQSAHDAALEIAAAGEAGAADAGTAPAADAGAPPRLSRRLAPWAVAALALAVAGYALSRPRARPQPVPSVRFHLPPPPGAAFGAVVESVPAKVSPDGTQVAMVIRDSDGRSRVWLRRLASLEARPVEGTDGATSVFWSPDSRSIAFAGNGKLQRIDIGSDVVQPLCDVRVQIGLHGTWAENGQILFATVEGQSISRVPATGGTPVDVVRPGAPPEPARVQWPSYLPGGQRFVYLARFTDGRSRLMLGEEGKAPVDLGPGESMAQYTEPGLLLYAREWTLFGQRFDAAAGRFVGEPFAVAQPVTQFAATGSASFSVSRNGVLVYGSERDVSRLTWFDRTGRATPLPAEADALSGSVRFSPDGTQALFVRTDPKTALDLWALDVPRAVETRLVSGPSVDAFPAWLPDGRAIVYSTVRGHPPQLIFRDLGTGQDRELAPPPRGLQAAQDVTPDGRTLVFGERAAQGAFDLFTIPLPEGGEPKPLLETPFDEVQLRLSPDGRFAAYVSNDSGEYELYLAAFPGLADKVRVSKAGAANPRWRRDGHELFYFAPDGSMMAVPVRTGTREFGEPKVLFKASGPMSYDVTPDGQRFLAIAPEVIGAKQPYTVALDAIGEALRTR